MYPRLFSVLLLSVALLAAGCSDEDSSVFGSDNVSEDELRSLLPIDLIPAGFHAVAVELNEGLPGTPPPGPTVIGRYEDEADNSILISITASGDRDLVDRYAPTAVCRDWERQSELPCPVATATPPDVGEEARAIESTGSLDSHLYTYTFLRDGITVGLGIDGADAALHELAPELLGAIDAAIISLAEEKLAGC